MIALAFLSFLVLVAAWFVLPASGGQAVEIMEAEPLDELEEGTVAA